MLTSLESEYKKQRHVQMICDTFIDLFGVEEYKKVLKEAHRQLMPNSEYIENELRRRLKHGNSD